MYLVRQITLDELEQYQDIPMIKEFDVILNMSLNGVIKEIPVSKTQIDLSKEESTAEWITLFNRNKTGLFVIQKDKTWIGGAIVVTHAPKIHMLQNNMNNAVLWDLRIDPNHQSKGLGKRLFAKVCNYAKQQECSQLLIETQNNNPKAIRFYQNMGAKLTSINNHAYKEQPDEVQYIFTKDLS